jgi:putative thioredoxin
MDFGTLKAGAGPAVADKDIVKSGTAASFMADVIEASRDAVVLVDFWAPWCGPCKQLTPVIEKVVRSYAGRAKLVKINIDEHPQLAQQLRVQSIPMVYAFRDGRALDAFVGVQPESAIRQIIDRLAGPAGAEGEGDIEAVLASGEEALSTGDMAGAAEVFAAVLDVDGQNVRALLGLATVYVETNDLAQASATLALIPPDGRKSSAFIALAARIELASKAPAVDNSAELETRLIANPADHEARYELAIAQAARGDNTAAVDNLLEIIRRERTWNEESARKQLVLLFEAWGPKHEATLDGRRKLSSLLFR